MKYLLVACLLLASYATAAPPRPSGCTTGGKLCVATTQLPNSSVGVSYFYQLTALNGRPAKIWSLAGGTLPSGITLTSGGVLQGTPTTAGTYNFTVKVQDSAGTVAFLHVTFTA